MFIAKNIDKLDGFIEKKYVEIKYAKQNIVPQLFNYFDNKLEIIANKLNLLNKKQVSENHHEILQSENTNLNLKVGTATFATSLLSSVHPFFWYTSIVGILYIAKDSFKSAYTSIIYKRNFNIDTLTVPIIAVCLTQGYIVLCGFQTLFVVLNRYILTKAKNNSKNKITDLFENYPKSVWVCIEGTEVQIPFVQLQANDIVVTTAGDTIPVDGVVIKGNAMVNQHILTGESQYAEKIVGDKVLALTTVTKGKIFIQATKTGNDTIAAQIAKTLNETVDFKSQKQHKAEKISKKTIVPTITASAISSTFLGPVGAISILQSHPEYKTTLASNIGMLSTLYKTLQQGILIKDGRALDNLGKIDTVIFNKTDTLTNTLQVNNIVCYNKRFSENQLLMFAAAAEQKQAHPIAQAIIKECQKRNLSIPKVTVLKHDMGLGMTTTVKGKTIHIGSARFLAKNNVKNLYFKDSDCSDMKIYIAVNFKVAGCFIMKQQVRKDADKVICALKKRNIEIYILSGDTQVATQKIADVFDIKYFAEALPDQKASIIKKLQQQGKKVCFVGHGISDTIANKTANVSISINDASSVAQDMAQVILLNKSIERIPMLFDLAKEMNKKIDKTFNIVAVPHIMACVGVLFFRLQFLHVLLIGQIALILGVKNSLSGKNSVPVLHDSQDESKITEEYSNTQLVKK